MQRAEASPVPEAAIRETGMIQLFQRSSALTRRSAVV